MAVFHAERNRVYPVMSNHHLRNKELSLKAKGLLSQMLSPPEDWDYTLAGLSLINKDKIDAIREAVREPERAGYIVRSRERDAKGRLRGAKYVSYEQPKPPPFSPVCWQIRTATPLPPLPRPSFANSWYSGYVKYLTGYGIAYRCGDNLLIRIAGALIIQLAVYIKSKNAKKYHKGIEYGSARWRRQRT